MRFQQLLILGLTLSSGLANAMSDTPKVLTTDIVFTNSTSYPMEVAINGEGNYEQISTHVPALATRTLASVDRVEGVDSNFDIQLSSEQDTLRLTQTASNDQFQFGASTDSVTIAPQTNPAIQRHATQFNGNLSTLAFNATSIVDGGNITYVLQSHDEKPPLGKANNFNLMGYNIWATTIYGSESVDTRLSEQVNAVSGYDALVLTEVFDEIPSDTLMSSLRNEYPYQSADVFQAGKLMAAGTRIVSRWPIEVESSHVYSACDGIQCAASRAVIYTKINKAGNPYHIFATHTQSSDDTPNRNARLAQISEMGDYIRSLNIPANEPVIMAGDFNVNKLSLPEDRDYMVAVLDAQEPVNTGFDKTYDSQTNHWAEAPFVEYLDYTLIGMQNLQPTNAEQHAFAPRSVSDALWGQWDLSDHYAVRGLFTYNTQAEPTRSAFPYIGDTVHVVSRSGHYLRAMSGGNSFVSIGSSKPGTWESWVLSDQENGKVSIAARDNHNITLDSYLLGTLIANSHSQEAAQLFEIVNLGDGKVAIKADNGKYFSADFGGGAGITASASNIGDNEIFTLVRP
jgi:endonuclease/exonuclease/phosphatase family metal-dependent hydrolase